MSATAPERPLLRYHGGKWRLAPWVIQHLPPHRVYVEPFGGAASVLLRKPRSYAEVYNDIDGEVVNLFRVVRERSAELTRALIWTPFARQEYAASHPDCPPADPVERARLLIVRSFMGHGGDSCHSLSRSGFRATAFRQNTTPSHDWASFPPTIRAVAGRLRGVIVEQRPAAAVIAQNDDVETLFYCDPPYAHETRGRSPASGHGYSHEMTDADHEALAAQLRSVRGMVVLSGYHGALYDGLFRDWARVEREALADGAAKRVEVLWFNAAAWHRLHNTRTPLFAGGVS